MNKLIIVCCIIGISALTVQALPIDKNIKNETKASESAMQLIQIKSMNQNCIKINDQQQSGKSSDLITTVRESSASPCIDCQSDPQISIEIKPANESQVASLVNSSTPEPSWLK